MGEVDESESQQSEFLLRFDGGDRSPSETLKTSLAGAFSCSSISAAVTFLETKKLRHHLTLNLDRTT